MRAQVLMTLWFGVLACQDQVNQPIELKDQKARASYSIGLNMGKNLQQQAIEVDAEVLVRGIKDALSGGKARYVDRRHRVR